MIANREECALVTGAASGIGRATVERLVRKRVHVIALDRNGDGLRSLVAELGAGNVTEIVFDLNHTSSILAMLAAPEIKRRSITQLVNNAGSWPPAKILDLSEETWNTCFSVNVTAPFLLTRELAPAMAEAGGGAIVNIASRNAFRSSTGNAAYDASKAALAAFTRTAAGELAAMGIRVNAVCPGVIATPANADLGPDFVAAYRKIIPMDRFGRPEEIASIITFLLSEEASFLTGETIVADGGQIACQDNERFLEIMDLSRAGMSD